MDRKKQEFTFCSLALGERYRSHALLLAEDITKYSPGTSLILLTDNPQQFKKYSHVLAFKHQQHSVGCYHDKRFVIAKALSLFNSCIFVDADLRILAEVPADIKLLPGITARSCASFVKHNQEYINSVSEVDRPKRTQHLEILRKLSKKLDLNLEDPDIRFVMEMLFVVTKQDGREIDFLKHWETIAIYCELNRFYNAEGYAIGLAAAKAGLTVRWDEMRYLVYFKDWIEKQKIKKGQVSSDKALAYFQQHEAIEFQQYSLLKKIQRKINRFIGYYFRSLLLMFTALKRFKFYFQ